MLSVGHFRAKLGKYVILELTKVIMSFSRKVRKVYIILEVTKIIMTFFRKVS